MKRTMTLLLILTLIISANVAWAKHSSQEVIDYGADEPTIYGKYAQETMQTQSLLNIDLSVVPFSQTGEYWSDDIMLTSGQTIADAGCVATSVAMTYTYFGLMTDPRTVNEDMDTYANPFYWYEAPDRAGWGLVQLNTLSEKYPINETFYTIAKNALVDGSPVILGYVRTSGRTHYVCVKGVSGSGNSLSDYTAIDPLGGGEVNLGNLIGSQSLYRIAVYSLK